MSFNIHDKYVDDPVILGRELGDQMQDFEFRYGQVEFEMPKVGMGRKYFSRKLKTWVLQDPGAVIL